MIKNYVKESTNLFRGLSVLKEEITDNKTGQVCTVTKAWNIYLDYVERGYNHVEIMDKIEERFTLEDYQYNVLLKLSQALSIVMKEV